MALVTGLFLANALLPHPQVWALFVLQARRGRDLQPRPAGARLAEPAARPGRRDRRGGRGAGRLRLARRGRWAGGRRRADRGGRRPLDVRDRPRDLRGVAARDPRAAELPARRGSRPAERARDRRRLPLSARSPGADRDLRGRHERDGVRHADGALPGDRAPSARRRRVAARPAVRGAGGGGARRLARVRVDHARSPARARGDDRRVHLGRSDRGLRIHDDRRARARAARDRRRGRLLQRGAARDDPQPRHAAAPAGPSVGHRVRAGGRRAEPRRPRGGRSRVTHVAAILDRLGRSALRRRAASRPPSRCRASCTTTPRTRRRSEARVLSAAGAGGRARVDRRRAVRRRRRRGDRGGRGVRPRRSRLACVRQPPHEAERCDVPAGRPRVRLPLVRHSLVREPRLRSGGRRRRRPGSRARADSRSGRDACAPRWGGRSSAVCRAGPCVPGARAHP